MSRTSSESELSNFLGLAFYVGRNPKVKTCQNCLETGMRTCRISFFTPEATACRRCILTSQQCTIVFQSRTKNLYAETRSSLQHTLPSTTSYTETSKAFQEFKAKLEMLRTGYREELQQNARDINQGRARDKRDARQRRAEKHRSVVTNPGIAIMEQGHGQDLHSSFQKHDQKTGQGREYLLTEGGLTQGTFRFSTAIGETDCWNSDPSQERHYQQQDPDLYTERCQTHCGDVGTESSREDDPNQALTFSSCDFNSQCTTVGPTQNTSRHFEASTVKFPLDSVSVSQFGPGPMMLNPPRPIEPRQIYYEQIATEQNPSPHTKHSEYLKKLEFQR